MINGKKIHKKGVEMTVNTTIYLALGVALFLILLVTVIIPIIQKKAVTNEFALLTDCKQFYAKYHTGNNTIDEDPFYAPECKASEGLKCAGTDICCDLYPDDHIDTKNKQFIGCCIPVDKKDKCPVKTT